MPSARRQIRASVASRPTEMAAGLTRRQAIEAAAATLAGLAAMSRQPGGVAVNAAEVPPQTGRSGKPHPDAGPGGKLRIATCQFPVSASPAENAKHIRDFMRQAAGAGAHLLHTSEASLSGYAGSDFANFEKYDWDALRKETTGLRALATSWIRSTSTRFPRGAPTIAFGPWPTTRQNPILIGGRSLPGPTPRSPGSYRSIGPACWSTISPTRCPRAGGTTISSR